MTPFREALTALAGLTVSGITHNYDVDSIPDSLARPQLPALLVLPLELNDEPATKQRGKGFEAIAFSSGGRTVTYTATHLLLVAPTETGRGLRSHLPKLIDLIDAYFTALSADVTLGGKLLEPARVHVEPGGYPYGGIPYHGVAFRHTWILQV